jgi:hypothetical protein
MKIDNVKAVVSASASLASIAGRILADGKVDFADLSQIPGLISALGGLGGIAYKEIVPEIKDLDPAELAELADVFAAAFDLADDTIEKRVEAGLKLVGNVVVSVTELLAVLKK